MSVQLDRHAVLMIVDVQAASDHPKWGPRNNRDAEARIAQLLARWRECGMRVVHVRHDSTEPLSPYRPGQAGNAFKAVVAPAAQEIVVAKQTNSAFIGTDLDGRLKASGAHTLVICGVLTHNSLEATVRNAGNLGYEVIVPGDACWTVDKTDLRGKTWAAEDVHHLSLANMHGEYAHVTSVSDILDALA